MLVDASEVSFERAPLVCRTHLPLVLPTYYRGPSGGNWHHPHDGRQPYAEHYACREEAMKR